MSIRTYINKKEWLGNNNLPVEIFDELERQGAEIDEDGIDALLNTKYAIKSNKGNIYLKKCDNKNIKKLKIKKYKLIGA